MEEFEYKPTFLKKIDLFISKYTKYRRIWELIRREIPAFFKNIWVFRKALWEYRWYNMDGTLHFMENALEKSIPLFEKNGTEVYKSKNLKIYRMKRLKYLLEVHRNHSYLELAEKELGKLHYRPLKFKKLDDYPDFFEIVDTLTPEQSEHNSNIYKRSCEIEEEHWQEIIETIRGRKIYNYDTDFDGNGIKNWWD